MRSGISRGLPVPIGLFRAMLLTVLAVGAMYGASIGLTCGDHEVAGQAALNLPDAVIGAAARAGVATGGEVAAIGAATPGIVALLSGADDGQHPDWISGCVLALTAILTVALGAISGRHGGGPLPSRARWSLSSTFHAIARSGSAELVPFSLCVLRR